MTLSLPPQPFAPDWYNLTPTEQSSLLNYLTSLGVTSVNNLYSGNGDPVIGAGNTFTSNILEVQGQAGGIPTSLDLANFPNLAGLLLDGDGGGHSPTLTVSNSVPATQGLMAFVEAGSTLNLNTTGINNTVYADAGTVNLSGTGNDTVYVNEGTLYASNTGNDTIVETNSTVVDTSTGNTTATINGGGLFENNPNGIPSTNYYTVNDGGTLVTGDYSTDIITENSGHVVVFGVAATVTQHGGNLGEAQGVYTDYMYGGTVEMGSNSGDTTIVEANGIGTVTLVSVSKVLESGESLMIQGMWPDSREGATECGRPRTANAMTAAI
jgi:hypothetical protein